MELDLAKLCTAPRIRDKDAPAGRDPGTVFPNMNRVEKGTGLC